MFVNRFLLFHSKVSTFLTSTLTEVAQAADVAGEVAAVEWSADGRASPKKRHDMLMTFEEFRRP